MRMLFGIGVMLYAIFVDLHGGLWTAHEQGSVMMICNRWHGHISWVFILLIIASNEENLPRIEHPNDPFVLKTLSR